jgi:hypothetical protein
MSGFFQSDLYNRLDDSLTAGHIFGTGRVEDICLALQQGFPFHMNLVFKSRLSIRERVNSVS